MTLPLVGPLLDNTILTLILIPTGRESPIMYSPFDQPKTGLKN